MVFRFNMRRMLGFLASRTSPLSRPEVRRALLVFLICLTIAVVSACAKAKSGARAEEHLQAHLKVIDRLQNERIPPPEPPAQNDADESANTLNPKGHAATHPELQSVPAVRNELNMIQRRFSPHQAAAPETVAPDAVRHATLPHESANSEAPQDAKEALESGPSPSEHTGPAVGDVTYEISASPEPEETISQGSSARVARTSEQTGALPDAKDTPRNDSAAVAPAPDNQTRRPDAGQPNAFGAELDIAWFSVAPGAPAPEITLEPGAPPTTADQDTAPPSHGKPGWLPPPDPTNLGATYQGAEITPKAPGKPLSTLAMGDVSLERPAPDSSACLRRFGLKYCLEDVDWGEMAEFVKDESSSIPLYKAIFVYDEFEKCIALIKAFPSAQYRNVAQHITARLGAPLNREKESVCYFGCQLPPTECLEWWSEKSEKAPSQHLVACQVVLMRRLGITLDHGMLMLSTKQRDLKLGRLRHADLLILISRSIRR